MKKKTAFVLAVSISIGLATVWLPWNRASRTIALTGTATPEMRGEASKTLLPPPPPQAPCQNIYSAVCLKKDSMRDPSGSVKKDIEGEIQALRLYEETIRENPGVPHEQLDPILVRKIYTPARNERMIRAHAWVEQSMIQFIESQPPSVFNASERKLLKRKIRELKLELPPKKLYDDEPDLYTKNDVFYERLSSGRTRLRIGGAYLFTSKSWFNLVFTLAHEMAHAIDPCELRALNIAIPSYDRLGACFLKTRIIATRKNRAECGQNDQLSEAFADWMAVQMTGMALTRFATEFDGQQIWSAATNSVRDLCEQENSLDEVDTEFHPSPRVRIEKIFGSNPSIRKSLSCEPLPAGEPYCSFGETP